MPSGNHVSHGETTIADLEGTANAVGTIALNPYEGGKAAQYLEKELGLPTVIGPTPIGIRSTDTFLANRRKLTGKPIPESLVRERGIAIDALTDLAHMFFADKRVAIYGNPDLAIGLQAARPRHGGFPQAGGQGESRRPKGLRFWEVTDRAAIDAVLTAGKVLYLALCDEDTPFLVPVFYAFAGDVLYFHGARVGTKMSILKRNPKLCFAVSLDQGVVESENACDFEAAHRTVVGLGRASVVEDEAEKIAALDRSVARFTDRKFDYPKPGGHGRRAHRDRVHQGQTPRLGLRWLWRGICCHPPARSPGRPRQPDRRGLRGGGKIQAGDEQAADSGTKPRSATPVGVWPGKPPGGSDRRLARAGKRRPSRIAVLPKRSSSDPEETKPSPLPSEQQEPNAGGTMGGVPGDTMRKLFQTPSVMHDKHGHAANLYQQGQEESSFPGTIASTQTIEGHIETKGKSVAHDPVIRSPPLHRGVYVYLQYKETAARQNNQIRNYCMWATDPMQ